MLFYIHCTTVTMYMSVIMYVRICIVKYSTAHIYIYIYISRVLYLSRDTSPSAVFFVQTSKSSALGGILYFE